MATTLVICIIFPEARGRQVKYTWGQRFRSLPAFLAPIGIFLLVVGSIYAGMATPAESAALGLAASLILAAQNRQLTWSMLRDSVLGAMRTTAMSMGDLDRGILP